MFSNSQLSRAELPFSDVTVLFKLPTSDDISDTMLTLNLVKMDIVIEKDRPLL